MVSSCRIGTPNFPSPHYSDDLHSFMGTNCRAYSIARHKAITCCSGGRVSCSVVFLVTLLAVVGPSVAVVRWVIVVVADVETKTRRGDALVTEQKKSSKDRLGKDVQHTVKCSLRVGGNDITSFAETPSNWVESPKEGRQGTAPQVYATNIRTKSVGVFACIES